MDRLLPVLRSRFNIFRTAFSIMASPDQVQGLDKSIFKKTMTVPYVTVEATMMQRLKPFLNRYLIKMKSLNNVYHDEDDPSKRHVLLNPDKIKTMEDFEKEDRDFFEITNQSLVVRHRNIDVDYDNFSAEEVLKTLLPDDVIPVSGWSIIGHIIHLNLKECHQPYKKLIGQVLLEKFRPRIRLVINKESIISSTFRNFSFEVLAQESENVSTVVEVRQSDCRFKFDFAKVYWNPRLDTEHNRIVEFVRGRQDILYDVFAGVGPFTIPVAKKKCKALANDLNPDAYQWLLENEKINKVTSCHSSYNLDGREFIKKIIKKDIIQEWKDFDSGIDARVHKFHITMNLPGLSVTFLDAFVGWLTDEETEIRKLKEFSLPIIHCYTFVKADTPKECKELVLKMIQEVLQTSLGDNLMEIFPVRSTSPGKEMYRVSFRLPEEVAFAPKAKRLKVDDDE